MGTGEGITNRDLSFPHFRKIALFPTNASPLLSTGATFSTIIGFDTLFCRPKLAQAGPEMAWRNCRVSETD